MKASLGNSSAWVCVGQRSEIERGGELVVDESSNAHRMWVDARRLIVGGTELWCLTKARMFTGLIVGGIDLCMWCFMKNVKRTLLNGSLKENYQVNILLALNEIIQ